MSPNDTRRSHQRALERRLKGTASAAPVRSPIPFSVPSNEASPAVLSGSGGSCGLGLSGLSSPYR